MSNDEGFSIRLDRTDDDVRIVVAGELDLAVEARLVDAVEEAFAAGAPSSIVIDLVGVTFIDSSGLRGLLRSREAAAAREVELLITLDNGGVVKRLLDLAGVVDWFGYA